MTLGSLLQTFAFATDLALGMEMSDGLRSCYVAMRLSDEMGLSEQDRVTVYYTALLKDVGCTCQTTDLAEFWRTDEIAARRDGWIASSMGIRAMISWMGQHAGADSPFPVRILDLLRVIARTGPQMADAFKSASEVCSRMSERLGLPHDIQDAMSSLSEQWDGKGVPRKLAGEQIPLAARVILPTSLVMPLLGAAGQEVVQHALRAFRGKALDPDVVDAFMDLAQRKSFWDELRGDDIARQVAAMEPVSELASVGAERVDDLALAFADFIDLKSPFTAAHSRRVGHIVQSIGLLMGCSAEEAKLFRRAGLMHDLGLVAVPSNALNKPERSLKPSEREQVRLHPYYGERILERVPFMADIQKITSAHHEHMDGSGFFRGLRGREIPVGSRLVAVADRLDDLTHETPGSPAVILSEAIDVLSEEAGVTLDPEIVSLVARSLGSTAVTPREREWPAGLTTREVQVLRLATRGLTRRDIGVRLEITENTVRHHLEHIYNKIGASTRAGATLFAMEHELLE